MSNHGFGYGLHPPYGGAANTDPDALADLIIHIVGGDDQWSVAGGDPKQGNAPTNQAADGPTLVETFPTGRKPYLLDAGESTDITDPQPDIDSPGGAPWWFIGHANFSPYDDYSMNTEFVAPIANCTGVSSIFTFYLHSGYTTAEDMRLFTSAGTHYFEFDGDGTIDLWDSAQGHIYPGGVAPSANIWENAWHIMTFDWQFGTSFKITVDGIELDYSTSVAGQTGTGQITGLFTSFFRGRGFADLILYNQTHTLAELNVVAAPLASARGITYEYTPLS